MLIGIDGTKRLSSSFIALLRQVEWNIFFNACRTTITVNKELHVVPRCVSRTKWTRWPSVWKISDQT